MSPKQEITVCGRRCPLFIYKKYKKSEIDPKDSTCLTFSSLKLGDYSKIQWGALKLKKLIVSQIDLEKKKEWVITNHPSRGGPCIARSMAEIISNDLGVKLCNIKILKWSHKKYYLDMDGKERLQALRGILCCGGGVSVRGKNVILIEDVTATQSSIRASSEFLLRQGAKEVFIFVLLSLKAEPNNLEKEICVVQYNKAKNGNSYLIRHINKEKTLFTSKLLQIVLALNKQNQKFIFSKLKGEARKAFIKRLRFYSQIHRKTSFR